MHVVIAGGTGLLGVALTSKLLSNGHRVTVLSRRTGTSLDGVNEVTWSPDGSLGPWSRTVDGADVVVNLAGAGIADRRWTDARKALLRTSRLDSTKSLVAAVNAADAKPRVFVQGSAVGYYGAGLDDRPLDESSPAGTGFLSELALEWEAQAQVAAAAGSRLVVIRTGVVLSREGGALPPMALPFRLFVGGPIGTGRQYLSWIAVDDWTSMVTWAIDTPSVSGSLNATAPEPVTNAEFSKELARVLGRPNLFRVPSIALRLLFGELADAALLGGQRVVPRKALDLGFRFKYATLPDALAHILTPSG